MDRNVNRMYLNAVVFFFSLHFLGEIRDSEVSGLIAVQLLCSYHQ